MRHEFDRKTKRSAWERSCGRCEGVIDVDGNYVGDLTWLRTFAGADREGWRRCDAILQLGRHVYDHIDPDYFSGCNDLENCQVLCQQCDAAKTAKDHGDIAKSKRIVDKAIKAKTSRRPFRGWRNFRGEQVWAKDRKR